MGVRPLPFLFIIPSPQFLTTNHHPSLLVLLGHYFLCTSCSVSVVFVVFFSVRFCIHPMCVWAGLVSPGVICISQQQAPSIQRQQPGQSESPPPSPFIPPGLTIFSFSCAFSFAFFFFFLVGRSSGKQTVNDLTGHEGLRAAEGH